MVIIADNTYGSLMSDTWIHTIEQIFATRSEARLTKTPGLNADIFVGRCYIWIRGPTDGVNVSTAIESTSLQ